MSQTFMVIMMVKLCHCLFGILVKVAITRTRIRKFLLMKLYQNCLAYIIVQNDYPHLSPIRGCPNAE